MVDAARSKIGAADLWVVKIGSALLTDMQSGIDEQGIRDWCRQIAELSKSGRSIVLVSSGAVAEGWRRLGFSGRPATVHEVQAAAAVGQMGLVEAYENAFKGHGMRTGIVLLTHDDLADRGRYLNARTTLRTLMSLGVVPVINENDSVATDEIKLGDNDTLAAMVASLLGADVLVLLTDQDGLHERDPREDPTAPLVAHALATDSKLDAMAGTGRGRFGRGGMITKLAAARRAARSGTHTVIANGRRADVLLGLSRGEVIGTFLEADVEPLVARKRWIADQLRSSGEVRLDAGAVAAIRGQGVSLLAVGVVAAHGDFRRGDMVRVTGPDGAEVAKGLVNYDATETRKLLGAKSEEIELRLGYVDESELIHRDNLFVF
ncbi:MAG: glutamate 5-kinase [Gammaproteobacteria bacterium]|nr:glutamate 5-kinase [Gammaproteobacteria bacterium]